MVKLLLISYSFGSYPLLTLTSSQRALSFAKHFGSLGFSVTVLTSDTRFNKIDQFSPNKKKIYNVIDPFNVLANSMSYIYKKFGNFFPESNCRDKKEKNVTQSGFREKLYFPPGAQLFWSLMAVFVALRLCKKYHFDCVLTISPPEATHLVGLIIKSILKIPWIADLRDGWMFEPNLKVRELKGIRSFIENKIEKYVLSKADRITAVTQPIVDDLTERLDINKKNTHLIYNGFEENEWSISDSDIDLANRILGIDKSKMTIIHVGRIKEARVGTDPFPFFCAIAKLKKNDPHIYSKIRIWLIGIEGDSERRNVKDMNLGECVKFYPFVPKPLSLAMMMVSDIMLLITSSGHRSVATTKLFDYLISEKPVLALSKGNIAEKLILETETGICVAPNDVTEIITGLKKFYSWWESGRFPFNKNKDKIAKYSRREQAVRMSMIIMKTISEINRLNQIA